MAESLDLTSVWLDNEQYHYSSLDRHAIRQSLSEAEASLENIRNERKNIGDCSKRPKKKRSELFKTSVVTKPL
jgi:hypothetical protein